MNDVKEKDPKAILKEWVSNVRRSAYQANQYIHSDRKDSKDLAGDEIGKILGLCDAMSTVLEHSS